MRLAILDNGQRLRARMFLWLMRTVAGSEDAVVKTALYRSSFFGRPFLRFVRLTMRGPSEWSAGERELFAALVSQLNSCPYCLSVHTNAAVLTLDATVSGEKLRNWRAGGFRPQVMAMLAFLEKLNMAPEKMTREDVVPLKAAGLSERAIVDALNVSFLFNTVNRLANAFGYEWDSDADARQGAKFLNLAGYRVPGFLLA
jgi:uncharacterized peroxidase-related enzyme